MQRDGAFHSASQTSESCLLLSTPFRNTTQGLGVVSLRDVMRVLLGEKSRWTSGSGLALELIETQNPDWCDLWEGILEERREPEFPRSRE